MRLRNVCVLSNFVAALAATSAGAAMSQDYPMRPVRIVTAPAGGGSDQAARLVAQGLSPLLGQQVIGGCTFDDVVDVTSFHTNPEKQFETFMRVKSEVFSAAPYPYWTAVGVIWLAGFDFEIKVIARVPDQA
jgi:enamine deaminase RidA (YjgF/YER057c/UK114 family)